MSMIDRIVGLALGLMLAGASMAAPVCSSVAKVIHYRKADIGAVEIIRAGGAARSASDMLCAGDRVKVAAGVHVTVKYLARDKPEIELNGPAVFPVTQIELPTKWANSRNILADVGKWFASADLDQTAGMATRGGCGGGAAISTALESGHPADAPFMLDAGLARLHFFWCGGVAPYAVEIAAEDGRALLRQSVAEPVLDAALAGVVSEHPYTLTVRAADGVSRSWTLMFKTRPGSPDGGDPYRAIVRLLCLNEQDNWRLQLWSQLQQQDASPIRDTLLQHLRAGDI